MTSKYERAAEKAVDTWLETFPMMEVVSMYSMSCVADRAAHNAGKKKELWKSAWDYLVLVDGLERGWNWHGTAGGSEYCIRNPYCKTHDIVLHASPK